MSWNWTIYFIDDDYDWAPNDTGFGDLAQYQAGVGFVEVDGRIAGASYARLIWIISPIPAYAPFSLDTMTVNYDYTRGSFVSGAAAAIELSANLGGVGVGFNSQSFNGMVDGINQNFSANAGGGNVDNFAIFIRSSSSTVASFSGEVILNYLRLEGSGAPPPELIVAGKLKTPLDATGSPAGNIATVDKNGEDIYIAAFNSVSQPTLVKIKADLSADGAIVFQPDAGDAIGVQSARYSEGHVWVFGQFDGTNVIEKSEDAGSSFSVKDPGTFGEIAAMEVGPASDDTVLAFDLDNGDIQETLDGGDNWTAINTSVTPSVNSIARYGPNPDETVFGNQGAANDSINYSPNKGANLEDYQTGVYPNANATKVIVT